MSTLFQGQVTSNTPRLTRPLSAETDISTLHKNHPTDTLGGNRLTSLPSSLHTWRKQTCQLCAKTVSTHPAETDIVNFVPSGNFNRMIGSEIAIFNKFLLKIVVFRCGSRSASGRELRNVYFSFVSCFQFIVLSFRSGPRQ